MKRRSLRFVVAVALLVASTAALAWLPWLPRWIGMPASTEPRFASTSAVGVFVALALVAAVAFLFLVRRAWSARDGQDERADDPSGRTSDGRRACIIVAVALALRLPALFAPPWLSDDLYRYLWEGKVTRAGLSPYVHAPDARELRPLRDSIHERVSHRDISAAYPPAAQLLFRVAPYDVLGWKLVAFAADLALLLLVLRQLAKERQPLMLAIVYGWHPLVALEFCGSGHVDAVALLAIAASMSLLHRGAQRVAGARALLAGALSGFAGMIKPQGFLLLVGFAIRREFLALLGALAAAALCWLPFAHDGAALFQGLRRYAHDWEFNALLHPSLEKASEWLRSSGFSLDPNQLARKIELALFVVVAWRLARALRERPRRLLFALLAAFLAIVPAVHPWYVAWLVPFLPFAKPHVGRAALLLTLTTLLAGVVVVEDLATGIWREPAWLGVATWLPPCALAAFDLWRGAERGADALNA